MTITGTHTSAAITISSQRIGLSILGRARTASTVKAMNTASAATSSHGLCDPSRARMIRSRNAGIASDYDTHFGTG